jgi:hypothetical protein
MGWIDCNLPLHQQLDVEREVRLIQASDDLEALRTLAAFLFRYAALQTHTSAQLVRQLAAAEHHQGVAAPTSEHHEWAKELLAETQKSRQV